MSDEEKKIELDRLKNLLNSFKKSNQNFGINQNNIDIYSDLSMNLKNKNESRNTERFTNESNVNKNNSDIFIKSNSYLKIREKIRINNDNPLQNHKILDSLPYRIKEETKLHLHNPINIFFQKIRENFFKKDNRSK